MLLEKNKFERGNIIALYLVSGDELIGEIEDVTVSTVVLSRPVKIMLLQNGPSLFPASFAGPQARGVDKAFSMPIEKDKIISAYPCCDAVEKSYQEAVSGIQVASPAIMSNMTNTS